MPAPAAADPFGAGGLGGMPPMGGGMPGMSAPSGLPTGMPAQHPAAALMQQYWSAVQTDTAGSMQPYAYLGALPFVPGLSMNPMSQPATAPSAMQPRTMPA